MQAVNSNSEVKEMLYRRKCSICWEEDGHLLRLHLLYDHCVHLDCFAFHLYMKGDKQAAKCPECLECIEVHKTFEQLLDDPELQFASFCRFGSLETLLNFWKNRTFPSFILETGHVAATCGKNIEVLEYLIEGFGSSSNLRIVCFMASVRLGDYRLINIWMKQCNIKKDHTYMISFSRDMNLEILEYVLNFTPFTPAHEEVFIPSFISQGTTERIIAYLNVRDQFIDKYAKGLFKKQRFAENFDSIIQLAIINKRLDVIKHIISMGTDHKYLLGFLNLAHCMDFDAYAEVLLGKNVAVNYSNTDIASAVLDGNILEVCKRTGKYGPKKASVALATALRKKNLAIVDLLVSLGQDHMNAWYSILKFLIDKDTDFIIEAFGRNYRVIKSLFYYGTLIGLMDVTISLIKSYDAMAWKYPKQFRHYKRNVDLSVLQAVAEKEFSFFYTFRSYANFIRNEEAKSAKKIAKSRHQ